MMQRLLRGWLLYLLLSAVALWLYVPMVSVSLRRPAELAHQAPPPARRAVEGWWPEPLDAASLRRLVQQRPLVASLLVGLTVLAAGMALAGAGLTVEAVRARRIRSVWRFPLRRLPSWSMKEAGRVVLLALLVASLMPFARLALMVSGPRLDLDVHLWLPVSMVMLDFFVILTILAFAEGKRPQSMWAAVGLPARRWRGSLRLGLRSYLAAFPWLILLLIAIVEIARALQLQFPVEPIEELIFEEHRPGVFAVTVVLACLVGPAAEECLFRGVMYPALRTRTSRRMAMAISGGLFAAIHLNAISFLPIMALGCLLAYVYERSGSLAGSLVVHMVHNTLLMGMAAVSRLASPT